MISFEIEKLHHNSRKAVRPMLVSCFALIWLLDLCWQVKSSHAMELEGFKRTLSRIEAEQIPVKIVATDRHISVNKEMDKNHPTIIHQFDVWHFAKNIRKRLAEKAKLKRHSDLLPWIQSISNHLWWSSATCGGDVKLLKWVYKLKTVVPPFCNRKEMVT